MLKCWHNDSITEAAVFEQMAQQQEIHDKTCRLIVSHRTNGGKTQLTQRTSRTMVRVCASILRRVIHAPYSRPIGVE